MPSGSSRSSVAQAGPSILNEPNCPTDRPQSLHRRKTLHTIGEMSHPDLTSTNDQMFRLKSPKPIVQSNQGVSLPVTSSKSRRRRSLPSAVSTPTSTAQNRPAIHVTPADGTFLPLPTAASSVMRNNGAHRHSTMSPLAEFGHLGQRPIQSSTWPKTLAKDNVARGGMPLSVATGYTQQEMDQRQGTRMADASSWHQGAGGQMPNVTGPYMRPPLSVAPSSSRNSMQMPSTLPHRSKSHAALTKHQSSYDHLAVHVTTKDAHNRPRSFNPHDGLDTRQRGQGQRRLSSSAVTALSFPDSVDMAPPQMFRSSSTHSLQVPSRFPTPPMPIRTPSLHSNVSRMSNDSRPPSRKMPDQAVMRKLMQTDPSAPQMAFFPPLSNATFLEQQSFSNWTQNSTAPPRRASQFSQGLDRRSSKLHGSRSQPRLQARPGSSHRATNVAPTDILHRENPDKRGLAPPVRKPIGIPVDVVKPSMETDPEKAAFDIAAKELVKERVRRANEKEQEREQELRSSQVKKEKKSNWFCGLFGR